MLKGALDGNEHDTVRRIAAADNAKPGRVHTDFTALLQTLRVKRLIRRTDDPRPVVRLRAAIRFAISYPALKLLGLIRNPHLKASALLIFARLCFSLAGWTRTIEAWKKCLPETSAVLTSGSEREQVIDTMENAARSSLSSLPAITGKERTLCCWFMLHCAGVPATLVMGVQFSPFSGHCWCEVDGRILTDSTPRCKAYADNSLQGLAQTDSPDTLRDLLFGSTQVRVVSACWWKRQRASSSSEFAKRLALAGWRVKEDDADGKG